MGLAERLSDPLPAMHGSWHMTGQEKVLKWAKVTVTVGHRVKPL